MVVMSLALVVVAVGWRHHSSPTTKKEKKTSVTLFPQYSVGT
jgi:hypothetical protein